MRDHEITPEVLFMVMACDGIWDCMSNQEVVNFVQKRIVDGKDLQTICEELMDWCLAPDAFLGAVGCDNMSVIVVAFLQGRSREEWVERCKRTLIAGDDQQGANGAVAAAGNNTESAKSPTSTTAAAAAGAGAKPQGKHP